MDINKPKPIITIGVPSSFGIKSLYEVEFNLDNAIKNDYHVIVYSQTKDEDDLIIKCIFERGLESIKIEDIRKEILISIKNKE